MRERERERERRERESVCGREERDLVGTNIAELRYIDFKLTKLKKETWRTFCFQVNHPNPCYDSEYVFSITIYCKSVHQLKFFYRFMSK